MLNARIPTQMDLEKLEDWASRNPMEFSKAKCKDRRPGWNKPCTRWEVEGAPKLTAVPFTF